MKFTLRYGSDIIWRGNSLRDLLRPDDALRFFSVCSGIEAASVAWSALGWQPVGFCEIEKFPSAVLAHHYPGVPNYGDFTKVQTRRLGRVDVLCGGTPCQAFSIAGARNSLDDARGNLTLAFVDLAHELADGNGLRNVVWENVPGVLSTKDNAFGCFLAGLVGADEPFVPAGVVPLPGKSNRWYGWSAKERAHYIKWPRAGVVTGPKGRAAWTVKDAQYFGLAQRRERVIVVADFGNGADPAAVLFEPEGVRRDSPPSRETGQGVAGTLSSRPQGSGGLDTDFDLAGGLVPSLARSLLAKDNDSFDDTLQTYVPEIARCVATREGSSQDYESTTMVATPVAFGGNRTSGPLDVATACNAHGGPHGRLDFESETFVVHGTQDPCVSTNTAFALGRNTGQENVIAFSAKDYGADATIDLAPTLRAGGHTSSHANAGVMPAVAMTVALRGREDGGTAELGGDVAFALRASTGGGDKPHVLTTAVRRLTPRECERLQGFQWMCSASYPRAWQDEAGRWWSPDYTLIPIKRFAKPKINKHRPASMWWQDPSGAWWLMAADGPRYKALGNSWAVPKFRWVGERIQRFMPRPCTSRDSTCR